MKRIGSILLILGILLSYLSCGSRTAARRHTLDYLHTMSEQFEKGDFEAMSATRIEFGEELERMNDADNADVLQAVVDFMKELQEQRGRSFSDYFGKLANYGEEISWKMPFYLMTRVYDAADAIIYDHAPGYGHPGVSAAAQQRGSLHLLPGPRHGRGRRRLESQAQAD